MAQRVSPGPKIPQVYGIPRIVNLSYILGCGDYVTISLRTKKIKGLHENDFIMTSKIDRMFDRPDGPPDR
jgi:hypothetical protein